MEFFKFFWADMGRFILKSLNYGYRNGSLSITQKQGVITCIPKQNISRIDLKKLEPYFNIECNILKCISSYIKQTKEDFR